MKNPPPMESHHHHQEVEVNLVVRGALTYLHGGAWRRLSAGEIAVFWAAVPHSLVATDEGTEFIWLTIPLAEVRTWDIDSAFLRGLLHGDWLAAPPGLHERFPMAAWAEELPMATAKERTSLLYELRGCLGWLSRRLRKPQTAKPVARDLRPLEPILRFVADHYQEPITIADIAAAAGLHPNYAMALFRRKCGLTIHDYITRLRVLHAQRRLLEGDHGILTIAMECGFGTQSAFYEAFRRWVGMTPSAYRQQGHTPTRSRSTVLTSPQGIHRA